MNVKTLTALVGSLSLGALATGCATAKPAMAPTEQGSAAPAGMPAAAAAPEQTTHGASAVEQAAPAPEKAAEHGCGAGGCGAGGCGGKK